MSEMIDKTVTGAILYDPQLVGHTPEGCFSPEAWQKAAPVAGALGSAGRGTTYLLSGDRGEFVLRNYRRGGLIGRFVKRSYVWRSEDSTRAFMEWRLLAKMASLDLPVPRPAAARYRRKGPFYSAQLLTVRIPGVQSLAERLLAAPGDQDFWRSLGVGIGEFHAAGVNHADLNAYNVQIDRDDRMWLLDFDRGRFSSLGPWRQKNIARLHRSLLKIKGLDPDVNFAGPNWEQFMDGYFSVSRSR